MYLSIPTKQDFQNNHRQAEHALLEYVALVVFPCDKQSDERASRFWELWQSGCIDLYEFWNRYGEIGKHEKEFADFCVSKVGKGEDWEQGPQAWGDSELSADIETNGTQDELPLESPQEPTQINDFVAQLKQFITGLPQDISNKFLVFFLSTKNFIAVNAAKAPSDMPKEVREHMPEYNGHLAYEKKREYLEGLYPFWACLDQFWGTKYTLSDQKIQQQQYTKLYKAAHIANSSREKKRLAQIVDSFLAGLPNEFEQLKQPLKDSILRAPLQTKLQDLPKQVISRRDRMRIVLPEVFKGCSQFDKDRLFLMRNDFLPEADKVMISDEYLEHRRNCARCKQAEESMREVMEYRYGRLKEIENKPIFAVHESNKEKSKDKDAKQLVSYYKERYDKIPCELHKYYLALAYKQSGEVEKGRNLLNKISSQNLAVSYMGTVISVYCACGKEDTYHLNALRAPKIAIGRLDEEDTLDIPQISVCQPDGLAMSRDMLRFEYQAEQQDWLVHPKMEQVGNLEFLSQDKLFNLLDKQMRINGESSINYAEYFEPLTRDVWLSDIAGIGIFRESSVLFKGQLLQGVKHPLLGRLPFGWYIEVKAQRRDKTMMKSFAERSFVE